MQPHSSYTEILFATDPICSHCWAMEPAWRRFLYHYGDHVRVRHLYGGLLPGWKGFSDSGGISQPSDIPPHWDEVAERYGQPIDASVWHTDPLSSSYPSSVAVHAVRAIAPEKEEEYLRRIRQALFLEARNIARFEVLLECAVDIELDEKEFESSFQDPSNEQAFQADLDAKQSLGIRGFPTLLVSGPASDQQWVMKGSQPFFRLQRALEAVLGELPAPRDISNTEILLKAYGSGTTREFAEVLEMDESTAETALSRAGAVSRPLSGSHLWTST